MFLILLSRDLPTDITSFTVSMYTRKTGPYKDKEMGQYLFDRPVKIQ